MGTRRVVISATDVVGAGSFGAGTKVITLGGEERRRRAEMGTLAGVLLAAATIAANAQSTEVPRAPRILQTVATWSAALPPEPVAPAPSAVSSPVSLAVAPSDSRPAPSPEQRVDATDEVVVIGEAWRLPDLGSEWRARQREQASSTDFSATALPLYDPNDPPYRSERSLSTLEERRHGYIELFRLRFGARGDDN